MDKIFWSGRDIFGDVRIIGADEGVSKIERVFFEHGIIDFEAEAS